MKDITWSNLLDLSLSIQIERDRLKVINTELLEALQRAADALDGIIEGHDAHEHFRKDWVEARVAADKARSAIKKAEEA